MRGTPVMPARCGASRTSPEGSLCEYAAKEKSEGKVQLGESPPKEGRSAAAAAAEEQRTEMRACWALMAFAMLAQPADSELPVFTPNLQVDVHVDRASALSAGAVPGAGRVDETEDKETCGCEDDFPPGAGFAFRREGYAMVNLKGDKVARQRKFFENERITFKEILSPGDGRTFPQVGSTGVFLLLRLRGARWTLPRASRQLCACTLPD